MHTVIQNALSGIMSALAQNLATTENVQYLMKCVARRARAIAEETDTQIDDILLSFFEGIAASYDKAEAIAQWIQDALIPNRCQSEEQAREAEAELSAILSESKAEYIENAAYFVGTILPILVAYYRRGGKYENET